MYHDNVSHYLPQTGSFSWNHYPEFYFVNNDGTSLSLYQAWIELAAVDHEIRVIAHKLNCEFTRKVHNVEHIQVLVCRLLIAR